MSTIAGIDAGWSWSGCYVVVTVAGKRERFRIVGGTATTLTIIPLRWYERLYFLSRDAAAWTMGVFS